MSDRFDCAVIGGGPAGSVAAALLAQAGLRTLLVERDREPHAGPAESLSLEAAGLLARLGVLEAARTTNFARHDLVRLLWEAAEERGARLLSDTRALKVVFAEEQVVGLRVELPSGGHDEIPCPQVIDASGAESLLAVQFAFKQPQAVRQAVIWATYQGIACGSNCANDRQFAVGSGPATFRLVPLSGDLTCLALVGDADYLLAGRGAPEEIFEDELVLCPALAERLISARLVGRFLVALHEPFTLRHAGNGWRIIGDARQPADPLDPQALTSAILAGRQAAESLPRAAQVFVPARRLSVPASHFAC